MVPITPRTSVLPVDGALPVGVGGHAVGADGFEASLTQEFGDEDQVGLPPSPVCPAPLVVGVEDHPGVGVHAHVLGIAGPVPRTARG